MDRLFSALGHSVSCLKAYICSADISIQWLTSVSTVQTIIKIIYQKPSHQNNLVLQNSFYSSFTDYSNHFFKQVIQTTKQTGKTVMVHKTHKETGGG